MRYRLEFSSAASAYLDGMPLTREGRLKIYVEINLTFASTADDLRFRAKRPMPDSPVFLQAILFEDDGRLRTLSVAVDDSAARYGVLRIMYADLQ
jgi:hypothetical protein